MHEGEEEWTMVRAPPAMRSEPSYSDIASGNAHAGDDLSAQAALATKSPKWNAQDFPPLHETAGLEEAAFGAEEAPLEASEAESYVERYSYMIIALIMLRRKSQTAQTSKVDDVQGGDAKPASDDNIRSEASQKSPSLLIVPTSRPRPLLLHRRSLSNPPPRLQTLEETPPTPALVIEEALTPSAPTSALPLTPVISGAADLASVHVEGDGPAEGEKERFEPDAYSPAERDVDPKTVFVGGFEATGTSAWDEDRLRCIFGKYGEIAGVRVFRNRKLSSFVSDLSLT